MPHIPYGRQRITEDDIEAVSETLRSPYLTCGPRIAQFEQDVAAFCGAQHATAVSNGTAALHTAMFALGIGPGDEVVVPPITFAATANCVLYMGAKPVFADVDPDTLLIDPAQVQKLITNDTKAVIGVDYAGQPCDWKALNDLARKHGLATVADACHALGGVDKGQNVGTLADMSVFSFHPVKHIATGEGGMILTDDPQFDERARVFRNHGITTDVKSREKAGTWFYEMHDLGFNYRMTDIQAALGSSQMRKLPDFIAQRRLIADRYNTAFAGSAVRPLALRRDVEHAYHLYVVRVANRNDVYSALREKGIFTQVHYIPVHLHPYYRTALHTKEGLCPAAEAAYSEILSLPMYPHLSENEQAFVIEAVLEAA